MKLWGKMNTYNSAFTDTLSTILWNGLHKLIRLPSKTSYI